MTARLMQEAEQVRPQAAGPTPLPTPGGRRGPAPEMGKVLPWRKRRPFNLLFHPGSGIIAAAALALFFVVAKGHHGETNLHLAPLHEPQPTLEAVPGADRGEAPAEVAAAHAERKAALEKQAEHVNFADEM